MQLSLDASNLVKHVEYNHCQLLLNKTPKGDSVGCFGKRALHWNEL